MRIPHFLAAISILIVSQVCGQENYKHHFVGMLEYKITPRDTALQKIIPENRMIVYTNDTIARIENFTGHLGKQIAIRHMLKDKSYLLVDSEMGKFAIQMDNAKEEEDQPDSLKVVSKYSFKKKCFKRKILGRKAKRLITSHPDFKEPIEFWYFKGYSKKLLDAFDEIPGLPVKYTVPTPDALLDYELVKMSEYAPKRDLFGISSEYTRISFDDFMDKLIEFKSQGQPGADPNSNN